MTWTERSRTPQTGSRIPFPMHLEIWGFPKKRAIFTVSWVLLLYGFDEKKAEEGVRLYREYYAVKGIFENKVYPGITHLLKKCREQGKKVILATSKPQIYAKQILKHFELAEYFDDIQGSSMDGSKIHKEDVIQSALSDNQITDMQEVLMIGDRKHDVLGSGKFGISCVGVLYGYGSREELETCGAKWIVDTVEDLEAFLERI